MVSKHRNNIGLGDENYQHHIFVPYQEGISDTDILDDLVITGGSLLVPEDGGWLMHYNDPYVDGELVDEKMRDLVEEQRQMFYNKYKPREIEMRVANTPNPESSYLADIRDFILKIELVPQTSWCKNLRNSIPQEKWDVLRKETYAKYGHKCGICGKKTRLNCHEIWYYDDNTHIQRLEGFIALCDLCHHVKHLGLAGFLAGQGNVDFEEVIEHFMRVNHCSLEAFEQHRQEAGVQWRERSQHEWTVEFGEFNELFA